MNVTIGKTSGNNNEISQIGMNFEAWTETNSSEIVDSDNGGSIFYMDPNSVPFSDEIPIGQFTINRAQYSDSNTPYKFSGRLRGRSGDEDNVGENHWEGKFNITIPKIIN